ncbi:E3 ubiquitin-protein ligase tom1 [Massospora cicadina]|nr:E3 ubiquitin-protein ligase tom1 [Massospora cicadina]
MYNVKLCCKAQPPFLRSRASELLRKFVDVNLPKSDLNNWIGVLNKFDRLLEGLIDKYGLSTIQKVDFSAHDKAVILAILALTKSLFDKCTNRNLYCSYERLNDLLNTNDLDILEMVLNVIMRPAQRVNAQRGGRLNFLISQDRISALSSNWGLADQLTLRELASPNVLVAPESFPIHFQFYGNPEAKATREESSTLKASGAGKREKSLEASAFDSPQVSILVGEPFSKGATPSEIFYRLVEEYGVPDDQRYALFQRVRIATAARNTSQRLKLLSIRLLALSVFCYVASEPVVMSSVFVYEPNLIVSLAGLLHPESDAPLSIQTAALHSLDSFSHFSPKLSEVLTAVGASTNHGVLLCMLKKVIAPESAHEDGFLLLVDALFSLLSYVFTSQSGGNMLITAGIVSLLVQFLSGEMAEAPVRLRYKGIQLMDNAIYGFPTAFSSFQASDGLATLVQRIDEQVDLCTRLGAKARADANEMEEILLIENLILLKGLVKFVLHMMQTSSTGVGLRNLIDSRLPASLKKIFEQPALFSPMVYGQAVNVMSTIIHNEPTSLSVLQEQGLPQTFLHPFQLGFPASAESLYPISNAFGAICLNRTGLELFTELGILDRFFDIFTSPEHVHVLEEPEVLTLLGGSFDELTRHHPALKLPVVENIVRVIRTLLELGGDGFMAWIDKVAPHMARNNEASLAKHLRSAVEAATDKPEYGSVQLDEHPTHFFIRFIDAICKFLDGFFQTSSHFDVFLAQGGYDALLDVYALPALPVDFPSLPAAADLVQVFRSANEGSFAPILSAVMAKLCATLDWCSPWLDPVGGGSALARWLHAETPDHTQRIDDFYHHGRALHGLSALLSDFSDPSLFTQLNVGAALLQAVQSAGHNFLSRLGHTLRATQWECILLQDEQLVVEQDGGLEYADGAIKSVYNVLAQTNSHLTGFFQGLVKVSMTRRVMSRSHKEEARAVLLDVAAELWEYFRFERVPREPTAASLKYQATGLAFLTVLLLDRRHQMFIHLLMLMSFEMVGGFKMFFGRMADTWQLFESGACSDPQLERGLKKYLEIGLLLMEHLSSHRLYADCPYLTNLLPASTSEASLDPAYPNDYLTKYRHRTALFLSTLWASPAVSRLQKAHLRPMANATSCILKAQTLRHDAAQRPRAPGASIGTLSSLFSLRRPSPDQELVQQLVDMGFPRDASEAALVRFGNNLSRAAEYLLTHPEVVAAASFHSPHPAPAEAEAEALESTSDMGAPDDEEADILFFKADIHDIPSTTECETVREHLRNNLLLPMFKVLDDVEEVVHSVRDLMVVMIKAGDDVSHIVAELQAQIARCLEDPASHTLPLARRLRLLGFLLVDDAVARSVLDLATSLFEPLVGLATQLPASPPAYLSIALVVIEVVLMYNDEPELEELDPGVTLANNLVTLDAPLLRSQVVTESHRQRLLRTCLNLLGYDAARDSDVLIAVVRLLMRLTREPGQACTFVEGGGLDALLKPLLTDLKRYMGHLVHVVIILRHLIETRGVLLDVFEFSIHRWFSTNKSRNVELLSFLKQNSHLVFRDPGLFVEAVARKCKLTRYDPEGRMPQIALADEGNDPSKLEGSAAHQFPALEPLGTQVMFYLIGEILSFKDAPEAAGQADGSEARSLYQCLMLQCLAELFYCFPSCRLEFLASTRGKASGVAPFVRSRSLFINYLLNDLLPYEAGDPRADPKADPKPPLNGLDNKSTQASNVIASLLIGTNNALHEARSHELVAMRRFVLDLIYRALQDAVAPPNLTQRYEKVMALCDLCLKVLTTKRAPGATAMRGEEEVVLAVAKGMIDKQFVPLLVGAINDLDMVYPTMNVLISSIMRPLEALAKLAIKLGNKPAEPADQMGSDSDLDELSESPSEDEAAEDFLRSSALGVIDGTNAMLNEEDDEMDQGSEDLQDELGYSSEASEEPSQEESVSMEIQDSEYDSEIEDTESESEDSRDEEQGSEWHSEFGEDQPDPRSPTNDLLSDLAIEEVPMLSEEEGGLDEDRDADRDLESVFENFYQDTLDVNQTSLPWMQGDDDNPLSMARHVVAGRGFHYGGNSMILPWSASNDPLMMFDAPGSADPFARRIPGLHHTSTHPLLSHDRGGPTQLPELRAFGDTHGHSTLENALGPSAHRPLSQLLSQFFRRLSPSGGPSNWLSNIITEQDQRGPAIDITALVNPTTGDGFRPTPNDPALLSSNERWYHEAHMLFGVSFPSKSVRVLHAILNRLVPAIKAQLAAPTDAPIGMEVEGTSEQHPMHEASSPEMQGAQDFEEEDLHESPPEPNLGAGSAEAPTQARVTTTVNGQMVDITDTGIDPTFLEALPDDLRQEVLNQHFQDNPPTTEIPPETSISVDFLNAIPHELRQEILYNERRLMEERATESSAEDHPDRDPDRDPAREQELEQDGLSALDIYAGELDDLDYSLPSHRRLALQLRINSQPLLSNFPNAQRDQASTEPTNRTQALQLVDRAELATLLRLIFVPQAIGKHLIHRILLNLCENYRTCSDLIALLLSLVQDGADDLASVDRSFAAMSLRPKPRPPARAFDRKAPNLITQRCLEALSFLLGANDHAIRFCLRELEGFSPRRASKKSKRPASKYPVVVLLNMLDRPNFLLNPQLMDQAMQLLSAITKVLSSLVRHSNARSRATEGAQPKLPAFKPPPIPHACLDAIVNILASGECSNKTFQYTLSTIQHLLALEGTEAAFTGEMIQRARSLSHDILQSLTHIQEQLALDSRAEGVQNLILTAFSPPSSLQARLLRLLKTLDYMHTRKVAAATRDREPGPPPTQPRLYEELHGLELWACLSDALTLIQEHPSLIHVATVLLPLIEAFMVICKHSGLAAHPPASRPGSTPDLPEVASSLFYQFTEGHRKLLNVIIRNNPSLMSGTFELLIKNHKVLDFDNKRNYFNQQLHKRNAARDYHTALQLNVRRQYVFEDSFRQFQGRSGQEIKYGKLNVKFHDEEGVDAGGVTREWFSVLSRQMFNPNYALFKSSANDKVTYQPNRTSWVNADHLLYFKFVGRIIGKAIYDGHLFDAYFTRSFYKHILGKPVEIRDLEAIDPEFYKSMVWMLENDITDVVYANFCVETEDFGRKLVLELKPGGQDITVTQENKFEYVQLVTEQKLYGAIKDQIEHFLRGFHEIIPKELIAIFNEQELELLISGLPDIDIDDWKNNTEYEGYTSASPQIQWFWRAVRSLDQSERAKLLQFVTGTSKVPLEGFAHLQGSAGIQKFQIHRDFASVNRLPSAHTCFNQLDIPMYESYEDLRRQLLLAIEECNTGFGFG